MQETTEGTAGAGERARPGALVPLIRCTGAMPAAAQFAYWRERWGEAIETRRAGPAEAGFIASSTAWNLGELTITRASAPALGMWRGAGQVRRDQIDAWFLTCVGRGSIEHHAGGRHARLRPGLPTLHSMGEPFERRRSDGDWVSVFFSRDVAPGLNPLLERTRDRPLDTPLGRLLAEFVAALERRLPELTAADAGTAGAALRQMLAGCLAPTPDRLAEAAPAIAATRRERVRLAVRRHLGATSLSPERLARLVGISRSNLYRLFEGEGGVAHYIATMRLRAALATLSDPADTQPIHRVAESVGFADAASFSRAFRRAFGCAPGEIRRATLCGAVVPIRPPVRSAAPDPDLPSLLRRL